MSKRYPSGFLSAVYNPLKVPNAPTIGTPTAGDSGAEIPVTAPTNVGGAAISGFTAISDPGGFRATSASSPVQVLGLTNGTPYTFTVLANNSYGSSVASAASGSATPSLQRAIIVVGSVDYLTISTLGNTSDFGDILGTSNGAGNSGACGSATRGVIAGGGYGVETNLVNVIQYVTFATLGNATDFGDLAQVKDYVVGAASATRGVFAGGESTTPGPGYVTTYFSNIEYITIATTGNALSFGDLTFGRRGGFGTCSSPTRGVFAGGFYGAGINIIDYITIASAGSATDFGDLTRVNYDMVGFSSSTRGVFTGGSDGSTRKQIQYITIASTGNATNFGDLVQSMYDHGGVSSSTRGLSIGGATLSGRINAINYVTIATTGNSVDFGDMTTHATNAAAASNCHGGI